MAIRSTSRGCAYKLITSITMLIILGGCETKNDDQIAKAQLCLDKATPQTADNCSNMVSSQSTQQSYKIRCGAAFVKQGFSGARFASAFEQIKEKTSSASLNILAWMAFGTLDDATIAYDQCSKTGSTGLLRLATLTKMATTLVQGAGLGSIISDGNVTDAELAQLKTQLGNPANWTPDKKDQIGQVAVQLGSNFCGDTSTYKNEKVCTDVNSAITSGGGSQQAIADALLTLLK